MYIVPVHVISCYYFLPGCTYCVSPPHTVYPWPHHISQILCVLFPHYMMERWCLKQVGTGGRGCMRFEARLYRHTQYPLVSSIPVTSERLWWMDEISRWMTVRASFGWRMTHFSTVLQLQNAEKIVAFLKGPRVCLASSLLRRCYELLRYERIKWIMTFILMAFSNAELNWEENSYHSTKNGSLKWHEVVKSFKEMLYIKYYIDFVRMYRYFQQPCIFISHVWNATYVK